MGFNALRRLSRADYILFLLLSAIGIWYSSSIREGALWGDEVYYAISANSIFSGNPYVNIVHMFAPAAKYIIGVGQLLFGTTSFSFRIGIVLTAVLTLAMIYIIAAKLNQPWIGILTVLSLAVIPLFATHATSAMLDIPLVSAVTALSGLVLLESETEGNRWRDIAVGVTIVLASATKAYGVIYVVGPLAAYGILRWKRGTTKLAAIRIAVGAAATLLFVFLPMMLTLPPTYYSGAEVPAIAKWVFGLPIIGGPAYAFSSSLYFNLFAGHSGSTAPSLLRGISWVLKGGPLVVAGVIIALTAYFIPQHWRFGPWWLPACLLLLPIIFFTVILPKGYPRYVLPIFPAAILFGSFGILRVSHGVLRADHGRKTVLVILLLLAVSPASVFLVGGAQLSADSQYDDVSNFLLSSCDDNQVVLAEDWRQLSWYFGDRYVDRYHYYLDPTRDRKYSCGERGELTLLSTSNTNITHNNRLAVRVQNGEIDYVVIRGDTDMFHGVNLSAHGEPVQTWTGYRTNNRERYQVTVWKIQD